MSNKRILMVLGAAAMLASCTPRAAFAQFPQAEVDAAAATRGAKLYSTNCARCHGDDARGTDTAPDMTRSEAVLHDRRENLHGKELGPLLQTLPGHNYKFNEAQLNDLSSFLSATIGKILRSGYNDQPTKLLSGDAKAGEAYFNGAGTCSQCHSPTGNLKGVASKYSVAALQQKWIFPGGGFRAKTREQVTVKLANGKSFTGDTIRIDDFNVTLKGTDGVSRTFSRVPGTKVTVTDPFAAHTALLPKYTDADIHNVTAYLETLK
ncbi:MAG: c-type cytochrome [Janthinobacterium lividum]